MIIPAEVREKTRTIVKANKDNWPEDGWYTLNNNWDLNLFTCEGERKADLRKTDGVKSDGYAEVDVRGILDDK